MQPTPPNSVSPSATPNPTAFTLPLPQATAAPAMMAPAAILKINDQDKKQKESDSKLALQHKTITPLLASASAPQSVAKLQADSKQAHAPTLKKLAIDESMLDLVITDEDKTPDQIIKCLEPYYKDQTTNKWDASGAIEALERLAKLKPKELRPTLDAVKERFLTHPENPYTSQFFNQGLKKGFTPIGAQETMPFIGPDRSAPINGDWFNFDVPMPSMPTTGFSKATSAQNDSAINSATAKMQAAAGSSSTFQMNQEQTALAVKTSPSLISSLYKKRAVTALALLPHGASDETRRQYALDATPHFNRYKVGNFTELTVTSISKRPSDIFLEAIFGDIVSRQPDSGDSYFSFVQPHRQLLERLNKYSLQTIISFSANRIFGYAIANNKHYSLDKQLGLNGDLSDIYGPATVEFSIAEIQKVLNSQKIYTTPELPVKFYVDLVNALRLDRMQQDYHLEEHQHYFTLEGDDQKPYLLSQLKDMNKYPNTGGLLRDVETELQINTGHKSVTKTAAPQNSFGFKFKEDYLFLLNSTLYQIGSMVVKSADNYLLVDGDMKLRPRKAGDNDLLKQIDLSGIRGFHSHLTPKSKNKQILTSAFSSALLAAGTGYVTVPAIGMGVWGGDPAVYWPALLDAIVLTGTDVKEIFINPSHQAAYSVDPKLNGKQGEEIASLLYQYMEEQNNIGNVQGILNLAKITNLIDTQKDIYQLAYHLKKQFPNEQVSFVNASDPDVTLGGCTGMYVLNCPHIPTTEENLAAMTTGLLQHLNRSITYKDPAKVFQTQLIDGRLISISRAQLEALAKDRT